MAATDALIALACTQLQDGRLESIGSGCKEHPGSCQASGKADDGTSGVAVREDCLHPHGLIRNIVVCIQATDLTPTYNLSFTAVTGYTDNDGSLHRPSVPSHASH